MDFEGFYRRLGPGTFAATAATMSPWDERLQHGSPPTALVAHAIDAEHPRDGVRIARIASEFLGPLPLATMQVRTRVARPGKRIEMIEAEIESGGRTVLSARVWRIATQPAGSVPAGVSAPDMPPAIPDEHPPPAWLRTFGYGAAFEWRYVYGGNAPGPAAVWTRPRVPLVEGEPLLPLERALLIADSANGISGELPMREWLFVPPSLSLAFARHPEGEWVLLEAHTELSSDGIGITRSRLADTRGYFGAGTQALLVEKHA